MRGKRIVLAVVVIVCVAFSQSAIAQRQAARVEGVERRGRVIVAHLSLPSGGLWRAEQPPMDAPLRFVYVGTEVREGHRADRPDMVPYKVYALRIDKRIKQPRAIPLHLVCPATGERLKLTLPMREVEEADEDIEKQWARLRALQWVRYGGAEPPFSLLAWLEAQERMHGVDLDGIRRQALGGRGSWNRRDGMPRTSIFHVIGGRAAVRETLQLQLLEDRGQDPEEGRRSLPIHHVEGVTVQSHPYAEMLGDSEGRSIELARAVPMDRFFVYLARPADVLRLLDSGAAFASQVGDLLSDTALEYGLPDRYMRRLGLTEQWARQFIENGAVTEVALFTPDLFFIDGTEVTIVCRVPQMGRVRPMLAALGVRGLEQGTPIAVPTTAGEQAWWLSRGELLVLSTHRGEAMDAAALIDNDGAGSLGTSSEFRYMLSQQPPKDETAAYVYFSDPFIRRLVSPEVKIAQFRRVHARGRLETLGALALLYKAEAHPGEPTVAVLKESGYLPRGWPEGYSLEGMTPVSEKWGRPAAMKSLLANPPESATHIEVMAYRDYADAYHRFWSRFFDPIAMRLDLTGPASAELTTFILPLLDSDMYNSVRRWVVSTDKAGALEVPEMEPAPVLMASVAPSQWAWRTIGAESGPELIRTLERDLGLVVDPDLVSHLGPRLHVALMDYNPAIILGSGDMLGLFGSERMADDPGEWAAAAAVATSLLRPAKLLVEVDDPGAVRDILSRVQLRRKVAEGWFDSSMRWYRVDEEDRWIYTITMEGLITLRFGVEVVDDYLVISSLPWNGATGIDGKRDLPMVAAGIGLFPGRVQDELLALQTSAQEHRRNAVFGASNLLMVATWGTDGDAAAGRKLHHQMFGFRPVHPEGGRWRWQNGYPVSTMYGHPGDARQPAPGATAGRAGLLGGLQGLDVSFQLEGEGMRSVLRWNWGE